MFKRLSKEEKAQQKAEKEAERKGKLKEKAEKAEIKEYTSQVQWHNRYRENPFHLNKEHLNEIWHSLHGNAGRMVNKWDDSPMSVYLYKAKGVQPVWDFALGGLAIIEDMKKRMIKGGLAYYDEDGKFHHKGEESEND